MSWEIKEFYRYRNAKFILTRDYSNQMKWTNIIIVIIQTIWKIYMKSLLLLVTAEITQEKSSSYVQLVLKGINILSMNGVLMMNWLFIVLIVCSTVKKTVSKILDEVIAKCWSLFPTYYLIIDEFSDRRRLSFCNSNFESLTVIEDRKINSNQRSFKMKSH